MKLAKLSSRFTMSLV